MGECSASSCDTHDVGKVIWDEDGKRPKGRNPWDGFCLRLEALNELGRKRKVRMRGISAVDIQELLKFLGWLPVDEGPSTYATQPPRPQPRPQQQQQQQQQPKQRRYQWQQYR